MSPIVVFVALVLLYSLVSARLERTIISAPLVFTAAGWLALLARPELHGLLPEVELFLDVAEMGLVLLLFTDASRANLTLLKHLHTVPMRLLSTGLLLTIALGGLAAVLIFPDLSWPEAGLLAAVLAPTDAGLGQIIVSSPLVPARIRQALNVEAGLNDGLAVPFLLLFLALAGGAGGQVQLMLTDFIVEQLGYGVLVGAGIGLLGGWLLARADRSGWMTPSWKQLGLVALPLLCLLASKAVGASMFIAAFVAGLAVQVHGRDAARHSVEFTEHWGRIINLFVFFLFGLLVGREWPAFGWSHALYAALSLTVVRMAPVALALAGTRLSRASVVFIGWFGPRGLASIVLGLVVVEHHLGLGSHSPLRPAVMLTILCSIVAHGLSALPGLQLYSRSVARLPPGAPELEGATAVGQPAA